MASLRQGSSLSFCLSWWRGRFGDHVCVSPLAIASTAAAGAESEERAFWEPAAAARPAGRPGPCIPTARPWSVQLPVLTFDAPPSSLLPAKQDPEFIDKKSNLGVSKDGSLQCHYLPTYPSPITFVLRVDLLVCSSK